MGPSERDDAPTLVGTPLRTTPRLGIVVGTLAGLVAAAPMTAAGQPAAADVRTIEVTLQQFRFVPSEIEVIQGETVRLRLRTSDVSHGLAIPDLGIDVPVRPGRDEIVELTADTPGRYPFHCSVVCGIGHGNMTGVLTVLPRAGAAPEAGAGLPTDRVTSPTEPDHALISLPTTRGMPVNRLAFRLVHRFSRPLDGGPGYGNLLEDFFGFDAAAMIGLELRYGVAPGLQIGIHRNNTRNIQLFGRYSLLSPRETGAVGLDAVVSLEGLDNLREEYSPSLGAVFSHRIARLGAVYVEPMWVHHLDNGALLHPQAEPYEGDEDDAFVLGLGARLRVLDTVFVVAEYLPRLAGFDQGQDYASVAVEKVLGGHAFQINFSNSVGTTPVQLAQGASTSWYIGFNISRRFY